MKSKKGYLVIDKNINKYKNGKNKNLDIYLYAYIKLCSDFITGISHTTEQKIHELTGIPIRTLQRSISRLRGTDLVFIKTVQNGKKRNNTYTFNVNPKNFFFVFTTFFYVDMDVKLKGLLLLIKSLCINNSNTTLYNKTQIAEKTGQDRGTVSKMMDELIEKNMLLKTSKGFILPANYFPLYAKEGKSLLYYELICIQDEFVLNAILELCKEKKSILFIPDTTPLKWISAKYPFKEKDVESLTEKEKEKYYLPAVLRSRCSTLPPKIESLNYFLRVLDIEYIEHEENSDTLICL